MDYAARRPEPAQLYSSASSSCPASRRLRAWSAAVLARRASPLVFKAARRAARAAATARTPSLPLALPLRRRRRRRLARQAEDLGAAINRQSSRAAADLTREPSRRPSSGSCGQARSQPDPLASVRAAAPCQIRRSDRVRLIRGHDCPSCSPVSQASRICRRGRPRSCAYKQDGCARRGQCVYCYPIG